MHRIRRLRFNVQVDSRDDAFAARGLLHEQLKQALLPALGRAFDRIAPANEVVHIQKLELPIRISGIHQIGSTLPELLARELGDLLARQSRHTRDTQDASAPWRRVLPRHSDLDALVNYLDTGTLPWPLAQSTRAEILAQLGKAASGETRRVLDRSPDARSSPARATAFFFRWLQLVPEAEWTAIARKVAERRSDAPAMALAVAVDRVAHVTLGSISSYDRRHVVAELLAATHGALAGSDLGDLVSTVTRLADQPREGRERRFGVGPEPITIAGEPVASTARLSKPATALMSELVKMQERGDGEQHTQRDNGVDASSIRALDAGTHSSGHAWQGEKDPPARQASDFALPVAHAGLLLIHPFLPRLFQQTGLMRHGEPALSEEVLPRAAALLSLIATGEEEVYEFELGFIKVLLGLRPEHPLPAGSGLLSPADREEVETLLHSAIEHWRALKNTSVQGLRLSFLQRPGLLRDHDGSWHLQVEPRSYDVLLDQLPWGISTVKLPWMIAPIFTDWLTH